MSIHIILGKPGAGKSRYALAKVVDELVHGEKNIVTNLPIKVPELNEYLQKKWPDRDCRLLQRLRMIDENEMREFWKFRGPEDAQDSYPPDLPPFEQWHKPFEFTLGQEVNAELLYAFQQHENGQRVEYPRAVAARDAEQRLWIKTLGDRVGTKGVMYVLDEAHIAFNARDWASLGRGALHYMSQHRKLGDTVFPVTQSLGNLDKQFRSVAEDYTVLRNEYQAQFGPFRGAGRFVRKSYYSEPQRNSEPYETATFQLDVEGLAKCYDTAKGIGVHGSKADIGKRAKGISIYWVFPILMAAALAIVLVPWGIGKFVGSKLMGGKPPVAQVVQAETGNAPKPHGVQSIFGSGDYGNGSQVKEKLPQGLTPPGGAKPQLWVTGALVFRGKYLVTLSDGRRIGEADGDIERVTSTHIVLPDGRRIYWRPAVHENTGTGAGQSPESEPEGSRGTPGEGRATVKGA